MKVENVVFDLGGVLIDWSPHCVYRRHAGPDRVEEFLREIATGEWNAGMDASHISLDKVMDRAAKFPAWREWILMWRSEWPTMLKGPISGTVDLLERVVEAKNEGRIRGVYALTNWAANTFQIARARFPFLSQFDGIVVSGEEGLIKPDPRFFQLMIDRYSLRAEATLFIDDVSHNIDSAQAMGFRTHRFEKPEGLRAALQGEGVI